jgi:RHO1 GDP-GTP exchange protein 1/2
MSRPAVHSAVTPPGDEELAALYNQVLSGFAEESPTSEQSSSKLPSPGERESPYNHFVDDGGVSRSVHPVPSRPTQPGTYAYLLVIT